MTHANFIHLRIHSSYSMAEGAIKPQKIADLCAQYAMPAVAVTDSGNLFGSLEFSKACSGKGVQPIIGCLLDVRREGEQQKHTQPVFDKLVLYAKDEVGYRNLLKLCSQYFIEDRPGLPPHVTWEQIKTHQEGLIALTAGTEGAIGKLLLENQQPAAEAFLLSVKEIFGDRVYIELQRHGLESQQRIETSLIDLAYQHDVQLVATNDVYFPDKAMFEAHDALLCIAEGRYISETDRRKLTPEHYFKSPQEMAELFADIPEAIENTLVIAGRCAVMSNEHAPILPHFETEGGRDEAEELRIQARVGLEARLNQVKPENPDAYRERLEFELNVIIEMKFPGYFLIVSDFIKWSKRNSIPVGPGRGSGAGSVVAWSLEITDLDPIRFGLLFERFLNPERVSMPDFDVDFCQDRRGEVIRYVQEKYGADRVAQIITFGKLASRAVLRDVGRVLQMPYGQVDKICKLVPNNPASPVTLSEAIKLEPQLRKAQDEDADVAKLMDTALKLEGLNRHASVHAAGVVIGDRPLDELVALYRDPRSDMPVVQYSMKYAEAAGLVKFDFLGLKTLTVIDRACAFINQRSAEKVDITTIPLDDEKTFTLLSKGDSVGVFQLESTGMRDTLRKLKPDTFEEIIALISLYRPGPMDNIPTYIDCKQGREEPDYLHPKLEGILKETYGVIIYQEQVMQIAQVLSGYTLGGADLLRRAMGKKIKEEMDKQRELFVSGAVANGVDAEQADGIFDLVAKFAGYGFNKSHAAAYALISYQTAWLKANYPVEFLAASMNLDIHDTDKINMFRQEAGRMGLMLLPPDVNRSDAWFGVEKPSSCGRGLGEGNVSSAEQEGPHPSPLPQGEGIKGVNPLPQGEGTTLAIRYGLAGLKGVGLAAMQEMVSIRNESGVFKDIFDFAGRAGGKVTNRRQIESLIKAGAFDALLPNRRKLFESIDIIIRYGQAAAKDKASNQISLFDSVAEPVPAPALPEVAEWGNKDKLSGELDSLGFYLSSHPLDEHKTALKRLGVSASATLMETLSSGTSQVNLAGVVMEKRIRVSPRGRFAYLQLSDASGIYEVAVFDEKLLDANPTLLEAGAMVMLAVEARKDEGSVRMVATGLNALSAATAHHRYAYTIEIVDLNTLPRLKEHLGENSNAGNATIRVTLEVESAEVDVILPGRYSVDTDILHSVRSLSGIRKMEEA